jgi:uncharacterized protein involved in exopolysaccharide biosynthesis
MHDEQRRPTDDAGEGVDLLAALMPLAQRWRVLLWGPLAIGVLALAGSFLLPDVYTSRAAFLLPMQSQSTATAAALSQLGALSSLVGSTGAQRSPAEQYVSLLRSVNVADKLIDRYDLLKVYEADFRFQARKELEGNTRIVVGKRDGMVAVEVDDTDRQRAADIANRYIEELRRLTSEIAITEAQQRRMLFEGHLKETQGRLLQAQQALQGSGFNLAALRTDARASAETYARLRAELTAAEIRLKGLRQNLADNAPEIQQQLATLAGFRSQLSKMEAAADFESGQDYVGKFREFKYQETLFEVFARQYELARLDESREGSLQVVDAAQPAERKSKPRRVWIALVGTLLALLVLLIWLWARDAWADAARRQGVAAGTQAQRPAGRER